MELIKTEKAETANGARVIALKAKPKSSENYCEHRRELTADAETQMLQCGECNQMISPWEFVWGLATERYALDRAKTELTEKIDDLDKRLQELRREEQNIKARIRNAKKEAGLFI